MNILLQTIVVPDKPAGEEGGHEHSGSATASAAALTYSHPLSLNSWLELGQRVVGFVADYYRYVHLPATPVMSNAQPGFLRTALPVTAPEQGEPLEAVLRDVRTHIVPGLSHWQSPRFFAYFPCNTSVTSMLADLLTSGFGVLGFQWLSSPACTELEQIALEWLAQLLDLPPCFRAAGRQSTAVLTGSASEGVLMTLLAAKARTMAGRPPEDVLRMTVYASEQTHSCLQKACLVAGIRHVRLLPTRAASEFALEPSVLEAAVAADEAAGLLPCYLCATIGTTSSCAVDPVAQLAPIAARHGLWLNVDAAWAGPFAMLPDQRAAYFAGLEGADSLDLNPHKGLLTGWECSALYVKDTRWMRAALAVGVPEAYLNDTCRSQSGSGSRTSGSGRDVATSNTSGATVTPPAAQAGETGEGPSAAAAIQIGSHPGVAIAAAVAAPTGVGTSAVAGAGALERQQGQGQGQQHPPDFKDVDLVFGHGRFRGLRLWCVLRLYGAEGLRRLMRHRLALQDFLSGLLQQDPRFELAAGAPPRFGLVCFRLRGSDGRNAELLEALNASGAAFMSHTTLDGRYVIRCAIGGTYTQGQHVEGVWQAVQRCATALLNGGDRGAASSGTASDKHAL